MKQTSWPPFKTKLHVHTHTWVCGLQHAYQTFLMWEICDGSDLLSQYFNSLNDWYQYQSNIHVSCNILTQIFSWLYKQNAQQLNAKNITDYQYYKHVTDKLISDVYHLIGTSLEGNINTYPIVLLTTCTVMIKLYQSVVGVKLKFSDRLGKTIK